VYFACRTYLSSEAVEQLLITHHDRIRENLAPKLMSYTEQLHFAMSNQIQPFFYEQIKEYTSRLLTFDSDSLCSFSSSINLPPSRSESLTLNILIF
jgi:hypothetical protein